MTGSRPAFALAALLLFPCATASAAPTRDQIRAALVYKFAQFVQWSPEEEASDSPIVIGILGSDAIRPALQDVLENKSLRGHSLELRVYKRAEDVRGCRILVIDVLESRQALVLQSLPKDGLLTIGEGAAFARQGGVIAVILDGEQVQFDLNLAAAEEAGLSFNPTLLGLAREAGRW